MLNTMYHSLLSAAFLVTLNLSLMVSSSDADPLPPTANTNFYQWANQEWLLKNQIPGDQPRIDNFSQLEDKTYDQLRNLLTMLKTSKSRTREQEVLVRLYSGFMDMEQRNARGLQSISAELQAVEHLKSHQEVTKKFAEFQINGIDTPIVIAPETDFKNSPAQIAFITQAGLGMERDFYLGEDPQSTKQKTSYKEFLTSLFKLASFTEVDTLVADVIAIETELAKIQWSHIENRDLQKNFNPTSVSNFLELTSQIYGEDYLSTLGMPREFRVNICQPSYLDKYVSLFRKTNIGTWKNYLRARLLRTYANLLTSDFQEVAVKYQKDIGLILEEKPMWKQGIDFLYSTVNMMVGRAYVEKYFNRNSKPEVLQLVRNMQSAYKDAISDATWLTQTTKQKALEKLQRMKFKIGYPEKWRDYSALQITELDPVENFRKAKRFEHLRGMKKIGRNLDPSDWDNAPHEINAYYNPTLNEFVLLAGILQEPFFKAAGDAAINYGGIGFIIGHEIGHGFDDQGSRFDANGNLNNWWSPADNQAYEAKKNRLIAQANAYEILPGTFLKGEQEIGEIMGDLSGAQIALQAFQKSIPLSKAKNGAINKDFFIQLARTWRSKWREDFLLMVLQSDPHPPSEFRANGIVKQFPEFYRLFDLQLGDKMYLAPEQRIMLW